MAAAINEDLLDTYKQYGVIQNAQVKVIRPLYQKLTALNY